MKSLMINTQVPDNCKIQESLKESCQTILPFKVLSEPILIFPIVFYRSVSDIIIFFSATTFKLSNLQALMWQKWWSLEDGIKEHMYC